MRRRETLLFVLGLLLGTAAVPANASGTTSDPVEFGMGADSIEEQIQAGVKPDYATFWIGPWTLKHGWGGPSGQMDYMRDRGITPAIHYYYWGDDITPSCVENGCWSDLHNAWKDKAGWQRLAQELVGQLHEHMDGQPVVILLETEFNKGGVEDYEAFDGYLAEKAQFIREQYPAAEIVLPLGNWNRGAWSNFDEVAAAADYVGVQGMRGSTRDSLDSYRSLYEETLRGAQTARDLFGKPVFVHDLALSTYPEPTYLDHQAAELSEFFDGMDALKAAGVEGMIYRSWLDAPNMALANYYGEAERHWGFAYAYTKTYKPSAQVWIDGVQAQRQDASTPSGVPVDGTGATHEASDFRTRTAGAAFDDADALDGRAWNLWSNGYLEQVFDVEPGTYDLTVRARGTLADGTGPHVEVSLAGEQVLAREVGTSYTDATARVDASNLSTLRIAFTNDKLTADEDRNLILDRVRFEPVGQPPVASIDASAEDLTVQLDATGSTDPDGDALTYAWNLGDGSTATGPTTEHAYETAGTYTIELTVDDGTHTATESTDVTVTEPNTPPRAAIEATVENLTVQLDATDSTDPDGDALTYAWNLGDGSTATGPTTEHAYETAGTYTIELTVDDGDDASTRTTTVEATPPPPPFEPSFSVSPNVNAWWVEVDVDAGTALASVQARVDEGAWTQLEPTDWGTHAKSVHAPAGSQVTFRATAEDGRQVTSGPHAWLDDQTESFEPSFSVSPGVNAWWVEVDVDAGTALASVQARVDEGAWTQLEPTDWGTWAKSVHAPAGSTVAFRATAEDGREVTSQPRVWLEDQAPGFSATFDPRTPDNEWWIEVGVDAAQDLDSVEACTGADACIPLDRTDWGTWATKHHVEPGTPVTFHATSTSGGTAVSAAHAWG